MLLGAGAAIAVSWSMRSESPAAEAREVIDDDSRFRTARDGAFAFGRAAAILRRGADACADDRPTDAECARYFSGAAAAQVIGVTLVNCRLPDVFEARAAMSRYLRELERGRDVDVPRVPTCR